LKKLIVAPGCVITQDTPTENIEKVVETVKGIRPWHKEWEDYS